MFFANEKCIVFRTAFHVPSPYSTADGARIHLNAILLKQTIWCVLQYVMSVVVKDLMSTNSLCIIKEIERTKAKIDRIYASSTKIKISIKKYVKFYKEAVLMKEISTLYCRLPRNPKGWTCCCDFGWSLSQLVYSKGLLFWFRKVSLSNLFKSIHNPGVFRLTKLNI